MLEQSAGNVTTALEAKREEIAASLAAGTVSLSAALDERTDAINVSLDRGLANVERTLSGRTTLIADALRESIVAASSKMGEEADRARAGLETETQKIAIIIGELGSTFRTSSAEAQAEFVAEAGRFEDRIRAVIQSVQETTRSPAKS